MATLNLVKVNQEYFPFAQADFDLLNELSISVYRIPVAILPFLGKTTLKGVKVTVSPWKTTWEALRASFLKNLSKDKLRFKEEGSAQFVIKYDKDTADCAEAHLKSLATYLTRYGFRLCLTYKQVPDATLVRILVKEDSEVDPSRGFDSVKTSSKTTHHLMLSPVARLSFQIEELVGPESTTQLFTLTFEDNIAGTWQENFRRSFDIKRLKKQDLLTFITSMSSMLGALK